MHARGASLVRPSKVHPHYPHNSLIFTLQSMLNLLNVIAAASAIFLAFLVATVRQDANVAANRWLALFLLIVGLFILDDSLVVYGIYRQYPALFGIFSILIFALAPPVYFTVSKFVAAERKPRWQDVWHFVPVFLFLLLSIPLLFSSNAVKLEVLNSLEAPLTKPEKILLLLVAVQILAYLFFSFRKLARYRRNLENVTASPDAVRLDWLWYFLWGLLGMVAVWFVELFVFPTPYAEAGWYALFYFAAIYVLGYFALRQKEVFPYPQEEAKAIFEILEKDEPPVEERRYRYNSTQRNELKIKLLQEMNVQKPYLDPELNLPHLARLMGLTVHEMSELINMGFGENFAQFVNRYRVEEGKRLLLSDDHAHLSMVGIAFETGFNSKTAFNTTFKKMTGVSPTEFREKGRNPQVSALPHP